MAETLASPSTPVSSSIEGLVPGAVFAERYEVVALLGHGGMGAVFRVRDRELGEEIALKVLKPEIAAIEGALDRFRREVKLARRVTHPNVARTYDLGAWQGTRFLTMELISGEPLSRRAVHGSTRLPLADVLRVGAEIARGLAAAHAVGVVHRDLKPDNVMVADTARAQGRPSMQPSATGPRIAPTERIILTDFGIARLAEDFAAKQGGSSLQTVGAAIGTPAYMAPEQLEGRELDGRADVYALGVVLFELLTGGMPFEGESVFAIAAARLREAAPDPRTRSSAIPEPVAQLVMDALARKREERPDAQTILQRLDALRGAGEDGERQAFPRIPELDFERLATLGPRSVAVLPFDAATPEARRLAIDLSAAVSDALSTARGVKLVGAANVRSAVASSSSVVDPGAVGRALHADLVVGGAVRVSKSDARVHLRLVDASNDVQPWAERIDGRVDDPFDLEDRAVAEIGAAVRARAGEVGGVGGPIDTKVRDLWERARVEYARFGVTYIEQAVSLLREAQRIAPNDPWILSALGSALTRKWFLSGASDRELIAEAEEITLRALAVDPTIGDTYATIGIMRLQHGETRAAVRAFKEAVARAPLHAEAHSYIGRLLGESGYVEEALRRLDLAARLDSSSMVSLFEKARVHALLGDRPSATAAIQRGISIGGALSGIMQQARLVMWWGDRELAGRLAATLEASGQKTPSPILPLLKAFSESRPMDEIVELFHDFVDMSTSSPRQKSFFYQLTAEFAAGTMHLEESFEALEKAAALPLIDLLWLDRCPLFDCMRDDARFVRVRATVAARVAEIWG